LSSKYPEIRSTTVLAVRHKGKVAVAADGQVTMEGTAVKHHSRKVLRLYQDKVIAGFAGAAADALTLLDRFEGKIEAAHGNLKTASRDFAREWRTDRILRRLEALLVVADSDQLLVVSGSGDIIEPDDGIAAIGSGGPYALAAARALVKNSDLDAEQVVRESMRIAADICVYTNHEIIVEILQS
jgi:ATP-dependent HslUV protease subunit HslV